MTGAENQEEELLDLGDGENDGNNGGGTDAEQEPEEAAAAAAAVAAAMAAGCPPGVLQMVGEVIGMAHTAVGGRGEDQRARMTQLGQTMQQVLQQQSQMQQQLGQVQRSQDQIHELLQEQQQLQIQTLRWLQQGPGPAGAAAAAAGPSSGPSAGKMLLAPAAAAAAGRSRCDPESTGRQRGSESDHPGRRQGGRARRSRTPPRNRHWSPSSSPSQRRRTSRSRERRPVHERLGQLNQPPPLTEAERARLHEALPGSNSNRDPPLETPVAGHRWQLMTGTGLWRQAVCSDEQHRRQVDYIQVLCRAQQQPRRES